MSPPAGFYRTTEAQLGVFARQQLCVWVPDHIADDFIRSAACARMHFGIHRIVGGAQLPEQAAIAAALRCGPQATLSGPAALRLLGVEPPRSGLPFVILVPRRRRVRNVDFPVRVDPDPDRAVATWGQVRVAGPVDALIDSALFEGDVGSRWLKLAHDQLRWRGLLAPRKLARRIHELGGAAPGGPALERLLDLDATAAAGDGERELGRLLSRFDPPPEAQVWVTPRRRVDWYFHSLGYGYEYQGPIDHDTLAGRLSDDARDQELRVEGVRLGYVTAGDLAEETSFLARVAGTLAIRAHELGVDPPVLRAWNGNGGGTTISGP